MIGLPTLVRLYCSLPSNERPFWDAALDVLGIGYDVAGESPLTIPATGPLIVVANHPFGCADGLVLLSLLKRVRADVRVLGNALLRLLPELRDHVIPVDAFGRRSQVGANALAARQALRWVRQGGALAVFPSGAVSHVETADGSVVDPPWKPLAATLVQRSGAPALPVFFEGENSAGFRRAGRLHPLLRTALLPRELLKARGRTIRVRIGSLLPRARLEKIAGRDQLIAYLRLRTYALAARRSGAAAVAAAGRAAPAPIAAAEDPRALAGEIERLPAARLLARNAGFDVLLARAEEIPVTLREIGRLRETAFRAVGEGSGRSRDLDGFDRHYLHLFVWHRERREVAGAYRAGPTDDILPRLGVAGLYTSTLFKYDQRLLDQIGPALELGRAFVHPEHQKDYSPLLLLWKAIGAFVAREPRYRRLFGPVSISSEYQSLSRQILARFLYATSYRGDLGRLVTPVNPPAFLRARGGASPAWGPVVRNLAEVGALLSDIEWDGKGVPVLVRQYLKLNARLLGFNIDPAFGSALDGLMLVDLLDVDRAILVRYMGGDGMASFLAHHGIADGRRHAS